jgi:hypothetical protein
MLLLGGREPVLDLLEPFDGGRPRGVRGGIRQALELRPDRVRYSDANPGEALGRLPGPLAAGLDRRGNGLREIVAEPLRLDLDAVPIRPAGELVDLLQPIRRLVGGDAEILEELDLVLRLLQERLAGLPPLLEGLCLLLEDAGEPGRRQRADSSGTRRGSPP